MHISDGVLPPQVWLGGYIACGIILYSSSKRITPQDIPKISIMTSLFFVASLIHIPIGPTSTHLLLNGLVGIILGYSSFFSIFLGLVFQALLFQHGGITTIGVNALMMGLPSLLAYGVFSLRQKFSFKFKEAILGGLASGLGVLGGVMLLAIFLMTAGSEFVAVVKLAVLAHIPVIVIESLVGGFAVSFIHKVKPELLKGGGR